VHTVATLLAVATCVPVNKISSITFWKSQSAFTKSLLKALFLRLMSHRACFWPKTLPAKEDDWNIIYICI
jgi:hypothetical protein